MAQILVVEDNEEDWDMLSRRLRRRGYSVVHATDGQQAVEMATRARADLILMDVAGAPASMTMPQAPQSVASTSKSTKARLPYKPAVGL
jgi:CheY-like chemotaxis protein